MNLITQENYGKDKRRYVSYDAIDVGFKDIFRSLGDSNKCFSIPKIGAGRGGGNWDIISTIINSHTNGSRVNYYVN